MIVEDEKKAHAHRSESKITDYTGKMHNTFYNVFFTSTQERNVTLMTAEFLLCIYLYGVI